MKHSYITVIGNVGSGKSTLSSFLAENLHADFVAADEFYKTNPFFDNAVIHRARWSLTSDLWFLTKRAELAKQIPQKLLENSVVQDSGLLMSWVYANSRLDAGSMTKDEMSLYDNLFTQLTTGLPKEDLVIYLHLPISQLLSNIKKRGREFEIKHHTEEYLIGIQKSLDKIVSHLRELSISVVEFNERTEAKEVWSMQKNIEYVKKIKELLAT